MFLAKQYPMALVSQDLLGQIGGGGLESGLEDHTLGLYPIRSTEHWAIRPFIPLW